MPWAIGSPEGGHDAVNPALGTLEDFDAFVARAGELGLEIALDFALQCSPDHPWVEKHPEWFHHRSDGSIAYAENPPKKYQDIYPIAFDADMDGIVTETVRVLRHWMAHGVRIFRVDNPHTKPVVFWERVIGEINGRDPDVIFLEEYLDSEKYQLRPRDWAAAEREGRSIAGLITELNAIRRRSPALRQLRDLHFHHADKEEVIVYSKQRGSNTVLVVVNLDPYHTQEATVSLDMPHLGLDWHEVMPVRDELTGDTYSWGRANYVRLEPGDRPAHVLTVLRPDRDPDWFKRAVFYEVLVRSFQDSNGDGIGDLKGITAKLDYLQWLGIDCLWLPPFFKSPLRDGGYDVSDYTAVLPEFGDLADFVEFVDAAHVMNHTSDQHPWFQESRKDPDGPYGDYYVWADDDKQYQDARIIFVDTEASNWTFDPVRKQYYWHRFFSHQPDLNYENPAVQEEMISALRFWLDLGIDGFRLDAVPYLYQEEGTNCENLPATHEFLKRVRKEIDTHYPDTVVLAEANQWPEDVVDYFGDYSTGGDESSGGSSCATTTS